VTDKVITISTGSYELNDITDFIYNKLQDYNLEKTFKIQCNNNTFQVEITTTLESVYFIKERSFGQLFDFHHRVLEPHPTKTYRSDQTVNILIINTILLECNINSGSYVDNTRYMSSALKFRLGIK